jgi:hypothetical protein
MNSELLRTESLGLHKGVEPKFITRMLFFLSPATASYQDFLQHAARQHAAILGQR